MDKNATIDKQYIMSEADCASEIQGRVCTQCGEPVEPLETVDNSGRPTFWGGCKKCSILCWGTSPETYRIAKALVIEDHFAPYGDRKSVV